MKVNIDIAVLDDLETLNKISIKSKSHWGYPKHWIDKWKDDLTLTKQSFKKFIINKLILDNQIIGFCAIKENVTNIEIEHLWLLPEFIGNGLGKLLLSKTLDLVQNKEIELIVVSDPYSEYFYKNYGFKTVDRIESYPKGRFLPVMKMIR